MPNIEIQVVCSPKLLFDLFEQDEIRAGMSRDVPSGTLTLGPLPIEKRSGVYAALPAFTLLASTVAINLFSAWLYDKLNKRPHPTRIIINRIETEITADGIATVITESITVEDNKKP